MTNVLSLCVPSRYSIVSSGSTTNDQVKCALIPIIQSTDFGENGAATRSSVKPSARLPTSFSIFIGVYWFLKLFSTEIVVCPHTRAHKLTAVVRRDESGWRKFLASTVKRRSEGVAANVVWEHTHITTHFTIHCQTMTFTFVGIFHFTLFRLTFFRWRQWRQRWQRVAGTLVGRLLNNENDFRIELILKLMA